ncbi:MAG: hypothetical protein ABI268_01565 [Rhodanobacter sp.]
MPHQPDHSSWHQYTHHGGDYQPLPAFAAGGAGIIENNTSLALMADAPAIALGDCSMEVAL